MEEVDKEEEEEEVAIEMESRAQAACMTPTRSLVVSEGSRGLTALSISMARPMVLGPTSLLLLARDDSCNGYGKTEGYGTSEVSQITVGPTCMMAATKCAWPMEGPLSRCRRLRSAKLRASMMPLSRAALDALLLMAAWVAELKVQGGGAPDLADG